MEKPSGTPPPNRKVGIYDRPDRPPGRSRNRTLMLLLVVALAVVALLLFWPRTGNAEPGPESEPTWRFVFAELDAIYHQQMLKQANKEMLTWIRLG